MMSLNERLRIVYDIDNFNTYVSAVSPLVLSASIQIGDKAFSWSAAETAWQKLSDQIEDQALQHETVAMCLGELFSGSGAKRITEQLTSWVETLQLIAEVAKTRSQELSMMCFAFAALSERMVPAEIIRVNRAKADEFRREFIRDWRALSELDDEYEKYRINNIAVMSDYYHTAAAVVGIFAEEEEVFTEEEEVFTEEEVLTEEEDPHAGGGHIWLLDTGDNGGYYSPYI